MGTDTNDVLVYHCLDLDQPVAANLARDEGLLTRVRQRDSAAGTGQGSGHD